MNDIEVENISLSYSSKEDLALDDVSFSVKKGELFGLIGPDGAGKTSLFRILTTLLLPKKGNASVHGWDIQKDYKKIRQKVGYMPGKFSLYQDLSVEENLNFFASLFNTTVKKNLDLIQDIYSYLEPFKHRRAGDLSGGMKQKLALCCALIHKPTVLFLDEPTSGVDTVSRKELWDMLKKMNEQGITILVSTSYMDEANLCQRIALMQKGKILSIETPKKITEEYPEKLYAIKTSHMGAVLIDLKSKKEVKSCYAFGDYHHCTFEEGFSKDDLEEYLENKDHSDIKIKLIDPTIEDCFINLMK